MNRRRRLGQHYLVDGEVVRWIIQEISDGEKQRILEIGTGRGILTYELCQITRNLQAYEIDRANYELTKKVVEGFPWVALKFGDAFSEETEFDVLVSSLPYSESSRFVEWLSLSSFSKAIVILQEDFVSKLMARPGERNYRAISVIAQCSFVMEVVKRIGRSSFEPQPRVNSLLVAIRPAARLDADQIAMIRKLFSVKKRKLGVALKVLRMSFKGVASDLERRVYEMEPNELMEVARSIIRGASN